MTLLETVCRKYHVEPPMVFKLACEYHEFMVHPKVLKTTFLDCCVRDLYGNLFIVKSPEWVEDFCLDVLANRVVIPKKYRRNK